MMAAAAVSSRNWRAPKAREPENPFAPPNADLAGISADRSFMFLVPGVHKLFTLLFLRDMTAAVDVSRYYGIHVVLSITIHAFLVPRSDEINYRELLSISTAYQTTVSQRHRHYLLSSPPEG
jgi:hypothetical protein